MKLLPTEEEMEIYIDAVFEAISFKGYPIELRDLEDSTLLSNCEAIIMDNPSSNMLKYVGYNSRSEDGEPVLAFVSILNFDINEYMGTDRHILVDIPNNNQRFKVSSSKSNLVYNRYFILTLVPYSIPNEYKVTDGDYVDTGSNNKISGVVGNKNYEPKFRR